MNSKTLNAWQVTAVVLAAAFLLLGFQDFAVAASTPDFLREACDRVNEVWTYGQRAIYIVGGIGIIVCAVFAFVGRFRWGLLFAIAGGVFLVATATELFKWLAGTAGSC